MSTNPRIYLDFNATAPMSSATRAALADLLADPGLGNPSSIHTEGRRSRDRVERARNAVAALVGRPREQVVFTSGGTEANALGVLGLAAAASARGLPQVVASSPIDHPSLRGAVAALAGRGWTERRLAVDGRGVLAPADLRGVGLLAVGLVNHELGVVADAAVFAAARAAGALVHVDAVQAAGKMNLDSSNMNLDSFGMNFDSLALSAHKLGGPQGIGALVIGSDAGLPLVDGGHQERGRRPGTENLLGVVGFGAAAAALNVGTWPAVAALGARLEAGLVAMGARIHGAGAPRTGGTVNAGFAGARGESIVIALDLAGVAASTGAACTSGSVQPSPVLLALGLPPEEALTAVRFSLGPTTTASEIDQVLAALPAIVARARR